MGGREELRERAVEGWEAFEGHTPHRPFVDAVRIACPDCGEPVERIPDVGNPWLDAGIVPFSTLHYREDPEYWAAVVPGRLHHRELPRPVPQLVLLDARDVDGPPPRGAVQDDLRLRPRLRRGRPADAQELGQRDRVRRGRRADGRRRHALDVRQGPARGQHPVRLARRRRGAARAARPVERLRVLRDATRGSPAGRRRRTTQPPVAERTADSTAGSCRAPRVSPSGSGSACADYDALRRDRGDRRRSSTTSRPGTCACSRRRILAKRRRRPIATPRSRRSTASLVALARVMAPILPFLTETMYRNLVGGGRPGRRPTAVHLTRWPAAELAAASRRARSRRRWPRSAGRSSSSGRCAARPGIRVRQPLARLWLALPGGDLAPERDALARADRRRGQRQGDRADRRRVGARRAAGQAAAAEDRQAARRRRSRPSWRPPARASSRSTPDGSVDARRA